MGKHSVKHERIKWFNFSYKSTNQAYDYLAQAFNGSVAELKDVTPDEYDKKFKRARQKIIDEVGNDSLPSDDFIDKCAHALLAYDNYESRNIPDEFKAALYDRITCYYLNEIEKVKLNLPKDKVAKEAKLQLIDDVISHLKSSSKLDFLNYAANTAKQFKDFIATKDFKTGSLQEITPINFSGYAALPAQVSKFNKKVVELHNKNKFLVKVAKRPEPIDLSCAFEQIDSSYTGAFEDHSKFYFETDPDKILSRLIYVDKLGHQVNISLERFLKSDLEDVKKILSKTTFESKDLTELENILGAEFHCGIGNLQNNCFYYYEDTARPFNLSYVDSNGKEQPVTLSKDHDVEKIKQIITKTYLTEGDISNLQKLLGDAFPKDRQFVLAQQLNSDAQTSTAYSAFLGFQAAYSSVPAMFARMKDGAAGTAPDLHSSDFEKVRKKSERERLRKRAYTDLTTAYNGGINPDMLTEVQAALEMAQGCEEAYTKLLEDGEDTQLMYDTKSFYIDKITGELNTNRLNFTKNTYLVTGATENPELYFVECMCLSTGRIINIPRKIHLPNASAANYLKILTTGNSVHGFEAHPNVINAIKKVFPLQNAEEGGIQTEGDFPTVPKLNAQSREFIKQLTGHASKTYKTMEKIRFMRACERLEKLMSVDPRKLDASGYETFTDKIISPDEFDAIEKWHKNGRKGKPPFNLREGYCYVVRGSDQKIWVSKFDGIVVDYGTCDTSTSPYKEMAEKIAKNKIPQGVISGSTYIFGANRYIISSNPPSLVKVKTALPPFKKIPELNDKLVENARKTLESLKVIEDNDTSYWVTADSLVPYELRMQLVAKLEQALREPSSRKAQEAFRNEYELHVAPKYSWNIEEKDLPCFLYDPKTSDIRYIDADGKSHDSTLETEYMDPLEVILHGPAKFFSWVYNFGNVSDERVISVTRLRRYIGYYDADTPGGDTFTLNAQQVHEMITARLDPKTKFKTGTANELVEEIIDAKTVSARQAVKSFCYNLFTAGAGVGASFVMPLCLPVAGIGITGMTMTIVGAAIGGAKTLYGAVSDVTKLGNSNSIDAARTELKSMRESGAAAAGTIHPTTK